MDAVPPVFVPLLCAALYVVAALMIKRAGALGVGPWRIGFLANWTMFFVFLPCALLFPAAAESRQGTLWQPALNALFFLGGQMFNFLALHRGDVSITTPVMGTKVVLVALLSVLLHAGAVPLQWWIGAACSTAAVALLHFGEPPGGRRRVGRTVLLAGLSALSFSLSDVLLQKWAGSWGGGRYLGLMFGATALYTFVFIPFFRAPLRRLDRRAWAWAGGGAFVLAVNNAGVAGAIALWRTATSINILYSLRGLFSVVIVWAVGHWFSSEEHRLAQRVFRARLAGAAFMLAAIVLVLLR